MLSTGFPDWALFSLAPVEATDQELVDQELRGGQGGDDELVMQLALDVWKQVCRFRKRGELLDAVENGCLEGAEGFLRYLYECKGIEIPFLKNQGL